MDSKNNDNNADIGTTESKAVIPNHIEIDTCSDVKLTKVTTVLFQTTTCKVQLVDIDKILVINVLSNAKFIIRKLIVENCDKSIRSRNNICSINSICNEIDSKNKNIATKADTKNDVHKIFTNNLTHKYCSTSIFKRYKLSENHVTKTIIDAYVACNNKRDNNVDHLHATVQLNFKELSLDDRK